MRARHGVLIVLISGGSQEVGCKPTPVHRRVAQAAQHAQQASSAAVNAGEPRVSRRVAAAAQTQPTQHALLLALTTAEPRVPRRVAATTQTQRTQYALLLALATGAFVAPSTLLPSTFAMYCMVSATTGVLAGRTTVRRPATARSRRVSRVLRDLRRGSHASEACLCCAA
jgi:hypothetical protein